MSTSLRSDTTTEIRIFCSPALKYPYWSREPQPYKLWIKYILVGGSKLYMHKNISKMGAKTTI